MAIDFTAIVESDTLVVRATGFDERLEQVLEYGLAVIRLSLQHGVTRVLCDERELSYRLHTNDIYASAAFIAEQAPHLHKVAIVFDPQSIEDALFWETVAVNRGLQVRMFKELDAARAWLGSMQ